MRIAGYEEEEIIGKPHNIIRHPDMPKSVFKLLWDRIKEGHEIFAYVINMSKNGDHYWVLAHVTPTFDESSKITGFHSNHRVPRREAIEFISGIYKKLSEEEARHDTPKKATEAAFQMLNNILKDKGITYDEFIFSF